MIKYFWPIKSIFFYTALLFSLTICFVLAHYSYGDKCSCQIQFTLNSPIVVDFAIYYDIGKGWNQNDFQEKTIHKTNQETTVSFCIPMYRQLKGIRFDPATEKIKMEIFSITLNFSDGSSFSVPLETLRAGPQILSSNWNGSSFTFESIKNANDPNFYLRELSKQGLQKEKMNRIIYYGIWLIGGVLLVLLGRFMILFFILGR